MYIVLSAILLVIIFYWISKKKYEKTDYYKQTHNSFLQLITAWE